MTSIANVISGDENRSALRSSSPSTSEPTRTPRHRPSLVALALGHAGRLEAAVHGDGPALVLAPTRLRVVVRAQQVLQRGRTVRPRQHAGDEVGGHPEPRHERLRLGRHEPLHRRLVVVDEALRRPRRLRRLAPRLGIVAGLGQRPCVVDDVVGRLHPHVTVGVEAGPAGAPGELVELADA